MKMRQFKSSDNCFRCGEVLANANINKFTTSEKSEDQQESTDLFVDVCFNAECIAFRLAQIPETVEVEPNEIEE